VAREVARRLGFIYVDTGAMYRAVALLASRLGVPLTDSTALEQLASGTKMHFLPSGDRARLLVNNEDVTDSIRTAEISQGASIVSTVAGVRHALVAMQQGMGSDGNLVMEGRDIGTVVFPNAEVKVFLDASPEERARRRFAETPGRATIERVAAEIRERDARDEQREHSPLQRAPGSIVIDTTGLAIEQVIENILALAQKGRGSI